MNRSIIHEIPLFYDGVCCDYSIDSLNPILIFDNINLVIEFSQNNKTLWTNKLNNLIEITNTPIKNVNDLNELSNLLGYGNVLVPKDEYINRDVININDTSLSITNFGIYIDNVLIMIFNHKTKTCNFFGGEILSVEESSKMYEYFLSGLNSIGYNINNIVNKTNKQTTNNKLFKLQNRLDFSKNT